MATISSTWTEAANVYTGQTIAASGTRTDDIDIATGGYFDLFANLSLTFHASATAGATVEVFGSANSGTSDSTDPVLAFDITVTAGATVIIPFKIPTGTPYVAVKVTNVDSGQSITAADLTYAGLKVTSA